MFVKVESFKVEGLVGFSDDFDCILKGLLVHLALIALVRVIDLGSGGLDEGTLGGVPGVVVSKPKAYSSGLGDCYGLNGAA